jgi:hypothetical protein
MQETITVDISINIVLLMLSEIRKKWRCYKKFITKRD